MTKSNNPGLSAKRGGERPAIIARPLKTASPGLGRSLEVPCCSVDVAIAASDYARRGWAVLPLHSIRNDICTCSKGADCTSPGKHPILIGGVHAATSDATEVVKLWRAHPGANVGIATGKISGLIALDVDPRNGGKVTVQRLFNECDTHPRTPTSDTGGGGFHRLFRYPETTCRTLHSPADLNGLDLLSDGAFIVAPPSRHVSGKCYQWRKDRDPASVRLSSLPASWLTRIQLPAAAPVQQPTSQVDGIVEGNRNNHLTSRAGVLRQANLSDGAILAALRSENAERCQPPLEDEEVIRIAQSVTRYLPGPANTGDEAEGVMRTVLDQHYAGGAHLLHLPDGRLWAFDGTCWSPLSKSVLSGLILKAIQLTPGRRGQNTASLMRQVTTLIEASVAAAGDPLRFNATPLPVLNCRNGEIWISQDGSVELRAHSATSYLRHRLDVDYDPSATCPRYDAALLEIFEKADDPEAMANFWDELMGYAAQADRREPLVVLGWGAGNNGKTRLLETYVRLIGHDRVVALAIGQIEKNRFMAGSLLGKLAIIDDDVRTGTRLPDGDLKRLSEEKTVTGENKFGPPFTFTARTAIFMLFNNPPSLADLSPGMQRRIIVVPFDRSFKPEETDKGLFQRIWTEELPGVLNRYLEGLRRVIRRRWSFAPPEVVLRAKAKLLTAANPVPAFVDECCERTGGAYVDDLYRAYKAWAEPAGITIIPQRLAFQRTLENLGFQSGRGNKGPKLHGVRLRPAPASPWPRQPNP